MSQLNTANHQAPDSTAPAPGDPSGTAQISINSAETGQDPVTPWYKKKATWGIATLLVALGGVYLFGYNKYSSQGHLYFWPETTDDWGVWGTWAAVVVGGGAVFYAATQVRLAAVSQREDRQQRLNTEQQEKERHTELVDAQNRLKEDLDRSARIGARKLVLEAGRSSQPLARSKEEVEEREAAYFSEMTEDQLNGFGHNEEQRDPRIETFNHVYVHLTNESEETLFNDLSLQFGVNVAAVDLVKVEKRTLGPALSIDSATPLAIDPKAALAPVMHQGVNQWLLPELAPREQVRATFRFQVPEIEIDWWKPSMTAQGDTRQLHQRISLGFRGPGQRYWIRLTDEDAKEQPFRLWELGS